MIPATVPDLQALRDAISPARLGTYLKRTHYNARRALELYAWNIRAGAALYPILQVNEVALRNAVNRGLESQFGPLWPYSQGFLRSLPSNDQTVFLRERNKLERRLRIQQASTGDVVAAQTYWFWVTMLTSRFENRIWRREFTSSFPHAPRRVTRDVVQSRADTIRKLRNRIAHHEPLMDFDLLGAYHRALAMVRWISPTTAAWTTQRWPPAREFTSRP